MPRVLPISGSLTRWIMSLLAALGFAAPVAGAQQGPTDVPMAELLRINDDTYVFRSDRYTSLFITTDEGVIVVDPIGGANAGNPAALRALIGTVTTQPVRYMVYSHAATDHGTGGVVFADTAQFVAHRNAAAAIAARSDPNTPVPTITVDDRMTLVLGGKAVELRWTARGPQDDYLTVHYRDVLMVVDNMRARELPFADFPDAPPQGHIDFIQRMLADPAWQWFVWGHASGRLAVAGREEARQLGQYIGDLITAVRAARAAGLADNSPEMVAAITDDLKPHYGTWANFPDRVAANVRGVVRSLE